MNSSNLFKEKGWPKTIINLFKEKGWPKTKLLEKVLTKTQ